MVIIIFRILFGGRDTTVTTVCVRSRFFNSTQHAAFFFFVITRKLRFSSEKRENRVEYSWTWWKKKNLFKKKKPRDYRWIRIIYLSACLVTRRPREMCCTTITSVPAHGNTGEPSFFFFQVFYCFFSNNNRRFSFFRLQRFTFAVHTQ